MLLFNSHIVMSTERICDDLGLSMKLTMSGWSIGVPELEEIITFENYYELNAMFVETSDGFNNFLIYLSEGIK